MSKAYELSRRQALEFTARFGFITQDLFFQYFCEQQQNGKYFFWRKLKDDGSLKPAERYPEIRYMTLKSRRQVGGATPARSIYFIDHDAVVARLYLELQRTGLLLSSHTEYELRSKPWEACKVLGSDKLDKLPDLVVDMKARSGVIRIAFEVERTRKADVRYGQMAMRYLNLANVDLILFCCNSLATGVAIERAFSAEVFRNAEKIPAIFLLPDFDTVGFAAETRFQKKRMALKRLLLAALDQSESAWNETRKNLDKPLSKYLRTENLAA